ncbi:transposase [Candidatus Vondammii sp. HM_W22]|uniref:transposase n=1 Tax=Candidatus Vondammii sp. HM_W22 TaxID=2687299 RepID=UPI001F12C718|nr:transposase [Candidatus Vondammii sp. HM_W22]
MLKVLVLQHLLNLNDDQTEFKIRDRYSFCRFLGLSSGRVRYPMPKRFGCIVSA